MVGKVQSKSTEDLTGGTTSQLTYTSSVTAHNTLVMFSRNLAAVNNVTAVSDNVNGAWTKRFSQAEETGSVSLDCWYFLDAAAGSTTVTVTMSIGATLRWGILEGMVAASGQAVDTSASNKDDVGSTTPSSGNITTVNAIEWLVSGTGAPSSVTYTAGSGWTLQETPPSNGSGRFAIEDRVTSSAGTYAGNYTINTSQAWAAGVIAFKGPAASGGFLTKNFWWGNY